MCLAGFEERRWRLTGFWVAMGTGEDCFVTSTLVLNIRAWLIDASFFLSLRRRKTLEERTDKAGEKNLLCNQVCCALGTAVMEK